ncbi:hypothetical protein [Streptomyces sp. NPDC000410]|uniref:hypothetical protein n=1 Tax=Streptomyces sp. NPDC000410 TaxID=3154254 RepID=UPI0033203C5F
MADDDKDAKPSSSDYDQWEWAQCMSAILGYGSGWQTDTDSITRGVSNPETLWATALMFRNVDGQLEQAHELLRRHMARLFGDTASDVDSAWSGEAADSAKDLFVEMANTIRYWRIPLATAPAYVDVIWAMGDRLHQAIIDVHTVNERTQQYIRDLWNAGYWPDRGKGFRTPFADEKGGTIYYPSAYHATYQYITVGMRSVLKHLAAEYLLLLRDIRKPMPGKGAGAGGAGGSGNSSAKPPKIDFDSLGDGFDKFGKGLKDGLGNFGDGLKDGLGGMKLPPTPSMPDLDNLTSPGLGGGGSVPVPGMPGLGDLAGPGGGPSVPSPGMPDFSAPDVPGLGASPDIPGLGTPPDVPGLGDLNSTGGLSGSTPGLDNLITPPSDVPMPEYPPLDTSRFTPQEVEQLGLNKGFGEPFAPSPLTQAELDFARQKAELEGTPGYPLGSMYPTTGGLFRPNSDLPASLPGANPKLGKLVDSGTLSDGLKNGLTVPGKPKGLSDDTSGAGSVTGVGNLKTTDLTPEELAEQQRKGQAEGEAAGTDGVAGANGMSGPGSGMPFMPPMGGMGGGVPPQQNRDEERVTWLTEEEEVWGAEPEAGIGVIGHG